MENEIKTILISPHSDDIAYSIGGSLLQNFFIRPLLMVTVFTRSNYAPGIRSDNSEIISNKRKMEDVKFTDKLEIKFHSFDFSEPQLRGYLNHEIFSENDAESDPIYSEVYNALSDLIKLYKCKLIVSPLGLGNHVDHIIINSISHKIARENNIDVIYYEDLHYAFWLTFKEIKIRANSISHDLKPHNIDITTVFNNKIDNIKLYQTQRKIFQFIIKLYAVRLGMEDKGLLTMIWPYNLFKLISCLFFNNSLKAHLFERVWIENEGDAK